MEAQIRLLSDSHGSTRIPSGGVLLGRWERKSFLRNYLRLLSLPLELGVQMNLRRRSRVLGQTPCLNPSKKMFNDTSSGIDKSGLDAKRCKNLAQAAPIDSFSNCSKSRMSIGREFMRLMRENE